MMLTGPTGPSPQLQAYLSAAEAALRAGNTAYAIKLSAEAAARGLEHPSLLTLAAYDAMNEGLSGRAVKYATRAVELAPKNIDALNVLGLSLSRADRRNAAIAAFDKALKIAPSTVHILINKGSLLQDMIQFAPARACYERALRIEPDNAEAGSRLANLAAMAGRTQEARDYAERVLVRDKHHPAALLAVATADLEEKRYEGCIARLQGLRVNTRMTPLNRAIAESLEGDALHGLGRADDAFARYSKSKAIMADIYRPIYESKEAETAAARLARLAKYFEAAPVERWQAGTTKYASPVRTHVFLVGFPRSGTTLLEQALASHGDVQTMDERNLLLAAAGEFIPPADGLDRLAALGDGDLDPYRKAYWKDAADAGFAAKDAVFIDKMPLNSILLCLVAKLFPQAKILFSLRDPRDVVLSCFRRRFVMTPQMYELLTLQGAARYYDGVMGLSERYRGTLGLAWHDLRYEDLVGDFDNETRKLCAFLGIDWDEAMKEFAARAQAKAISTPSAAQVARGLYTQGIGQWRAYAKHIAPVLPVLATWIARYGYGES